MIFVSYKQFVEDILDFSKQLPYFDAVVGIPRSGMLPATILSQLWHVPLTSLDCFKQDKFYRGNRLKKTKDEIKNILIIDDSCGTGRSLAHHIKTIPNEIKQKYNIKYATVYYFENRENLDFYYKQLKDLRLFQWNIFNHGHITERTAFDMDGVLCEAPTTEQNDYGSKYEDFLKTTNPLIKPKLEMGAIITGRLEQYRKQTEEWLKKQGYKYKTLIMRPNKTTKHDEHKSKHYKELDLSLFVEDYEWLAESISSKTKKPVLCITNWRLYKWGFSQ